MNYQDLFQCLKGVGLMDLSGFALPVSDTGYALYPINCSAGQIDHSIVTMLTNARNANSKSFLTFFTATPERTYKWLSNFVASDPTRILFALKEMRTHRLYGYMGLAYGDRDGKRIEGDAIVRYAEQSEPGLMRLAFLHLVEWIRKSLGFDQIWVRVLSDNPAVSFYKQCNFIVVSEAPLYEIRSSSGELQALAESMTSDADSISDRTLSYMKYLPSL